MLNHWYHHRGQLTVYLRLLETPCHRFEQDRIVLFGSECGRFGVYELEPRTGRGTRLPVCGDGLEGGNLKWVEVGPDGDSEGWHALTPGS